MRYLIICLLTVTSFFIVFVIDANKSSSQTLKDVDNHVKSCGYDNECITFWREHKYKLYCVDSESAKYLGRGSMELAQQIADICLSRALVLYHPDIKLQDIKKAEREAPNGDLSNLIGKIPGVGDASGVGGILTLRATQNFDCRADHPGGSNMICNAPIDQKFIDEGWPYWRDDFGQNRSEYDKMELGFMIRDQERRMELQKLAPH